MPDSVATLEAWGLCSAPFQWHVFCTAEFRIAVTFDEDGTWGYQKYAALQIRGQAEPFHHTGRYVLTKVAEPTPNPLARARA